MTEKEKTISEIESLARDFSVMVMDPFELRLVISGLKRLRHQLRGDIRKQKREGWKPEQGKANNNELRLAGVDNLLKRYGA